MKPLSIRLTDSAVQAATETYGKPITGAQIAVEGYFQIRKRELETLKGVFTRAEMTAIVANLNGTLLTPEFQPRPELLWMHLEDGERYEGIITQYGADPEAVREKIMNLTPAQTWFLQDEVVRFWNQDPGTTNLDEFLDRYAQPG